MEKANGMIRRYEEAVNSYDYDLSKKRGKTKLYYNLSF